MRLTFLLPRRLRRAGGDAAVVYMKRDTYGRWLGVEHKKGSNEVAISDRLYGELVMESRQNKLRFGERRGR